MRRILKELRLYWWRRAYNKVWNSLALKDKNIVCPSKNEEDCYRLAEHVSTKLQLQLHKCKIVLDVGCGNGNLGERIFKDSNLLIQTDYCFNALKFIKRSEGSLKKYVLQSRIGNLPFKDSTFDCIFLYSVIHYAGSSENARSWIRLVLRLLKDGGRLYVGDVPIKERLYQELKYRIKKVRSLNDIKYFFAELMQISFLIDDFKDIECVEELKIIPEPSYLKCSKWRVDIEIQKGIK